MIEIRPLEHATFQDGLRAWNDGFEGYDWSAAMTMSSWLDHMAHEGLQPDLSLIAYDGSRPIGCVLSGMRTIEGAQLAYNGGTGVATDYRGKGVGRRLIEASLERYREQAADLATLEVVVSNDPALSLYRSMGYEVVDRLSVMQGEPLTEVPSDASAYRFTEVEPPALQRIAFYRSSVPWQCQWQSVRDGLAVVAASQDGRAIAYALVRRTWGEGAAPAAVGLYQAAVVPGHPDSGQALLALLSHVFRGAGRLFAMNIQDSDPECKAALEKLGFTEAVAQFSMRLNLRAKEM